MVKGAQSGRGRDEGCQFKDKWLTMKNQRLESRPSGSTQFQLALCEDEEEQTANAA
jgi:hypothetical protein